jgi:hypothetical protein
LEILRRHSDRVALHVLRSKREVRDFLAAVA